MQKLELTWIGKGTKPKLEPRILLNDPSRNYGDNDTDNMLIHGDNLLVLKALEQDYIGRVKCIYIDPPYNTGSAFEHYDDNVEHSTWLNLMRPRLVLLRNLLAEDGVIFIQIDENEYPYLKILLHEVFGRKNEIGDFIWQKKKGGGNDSRYIAIEHEYVMSFAKNKSILSPWFVEYSDEYLERFNENDENGRYFWDTFMRASGKQYYSIECPDGTVLDTDRNGQPISWLRSEARFKRDLEMGAVRIIKIGDRWSVQFKQYMSKGKKPRSILTNMPTNSDAKNEILALFGDPKAFDFPKPEGLVEYFLSIATSPGDLVLDSFLGSGTTAAVAHKMGRRWIGIEFNGTAYTHALPRLQKVVDGEQGGISKAVNWQGGGGFKFYELAPTLIVIDQYGFPIIQEVYRANATMLAAAVCKLCNFRYDPCDRNPYIHGRNNAGGSMFVTGDYVSEPMLDNIARQFREDETLIICATAFAVGLRDRYPNIMFRKIPQAVLDRCTYGETDYKLNIVEIPDFEETEEDFEDAE